MVFSPPPVPGLPLNSGVAACIVLAWGRMEWSSPHLLSLFLPLGVVLAGPWMGEGRRGAHPPPPPLPVPVQDLKSFHRRSLHQFRFKIKQFPNSMGKLYKTSIRGNFGSCKTFTYMHGKAKSVRKKTITFNPFQTVKKNSS